MCCIHFCSSAVSTDSTPEPLRYRQARPLPLISREDINMDGAAILEARRVEITHIRPTPRALAQQQQQQEVAGAPARPNDEEGLSEIAEEGSVSGEEVAAPDEGTRVWERRGAMSAQGGASAEAVAREGVAPARVRREDFNGVQGGGSAGHWYQRFWGVLTHTL